MSLVNKSSENMSCAELALQVTAGRSDKRSQSISKKRKISGILEKHDVYFESFLYSLGRCLSREDNGGWLQARGFREMKPSINHGYSAGDTKHENLELSL